MSDENISFSRLPVRLQEAVVTIGCFMAGAPLPPESARPIIATITLANFPLLVGVKR